MNKTTSHCFIPITKNASSWGGTIFSNLGFEEVHYADTKQLKILNKTFIVFLRDPIERWKSGVAQWYFVTWLKKYNKTVSKVNIDNFTLELLTTVVQIEEHTWPQMNWVKHLNLGKTAFFNIDHDDFQQNFEYFLYSDLNIPKSKLLKIRMNEDAQANKNISQENLLKKHIINQLSQIGQKQLNRVKEFYKEDIQFIEGCNYYKPRENL